MRTTQYSLHKLNPDGLKLLLKKKIKQWMESNGLVVGCKRNTSHSLLNRMMTDIDFFMGYVSLCNLVPGFDSFIIRTWNRFFNIKSQYSYHLEYLQYFRYFNCYTYNV